MLWNEHKAVRMLKPDQILDMINSVHSDDRMVKSDYMERYARMPEEIQCALGYMRCLFESGLLGTYSAYARFCMNCFERIPPMRLPIRFVGWAGAHNNIGPVYELDAACLFYEHSKLFYTDDDIMNDPARARYLAEKISAESSAISDIRAEKLISMQTMDHTERAERWCVTFGLSKETPRDIIVNGRTMRFGTNDSSLFVLPKAGEFNCILGEIINENKDHCFILAKHNYCMK